MSTESKSDAAVKLLVNALRAQKQCDEDGVMCIVSRQAVDEAIAMLERHSTVTAAPAITEEELLDLRALSTLPMLARSVRQVCAKAAAALSGFATCGTCPCCEYLVKELREIRDGCLTETQMRVNAAVALNLRPSSGVAAQGDKIGSASVEAQS